METITRTSPLIGRYRFKKVKMVKGRQDWNCCECNVLLPKGLVHQHVKGMWGQSELEFRTCDRCIDQWDELKEKYPDRALLPFTHGDLFEAIAYLTSQQMAC